MENLHWLLLVVVIGKGVGGMGEGGGVVEEECKKSYKDTILRLPQLIGGFLYRKCYNKC